MKPDAVGTNAKSRTNERCETNEKSRINEKCENG